MTQKLLSRDCSYRQTQKISYEKANVKGDLSEIAHAQRGRPSIKCPPTASSYDGQQDAAPYKRFTRSLASTCFSQKKSVFTAMVIIQKTLCMKSLAQK